MFKKNVYIAIPKTRNVSTAYKQKIATKRKINTRTKNVKRTNIPKKRRPCVKSIRKEFNTKI